MKKAQVSTSFSEEKEAKRLLLISPFVMARLDPAIHAFRFL
jgi:hypothetical protein